MATLATKQREALDARDVIDQANKKVVKEVVKEVVEVPKKVKAKSKVAKKK